MTLHDVVVIFASHAVLRVLAAFLSVGIVKGSILVLAAWLACRLFCARLPWRARRIWQATLIGLVLLPLAWLALPPIRVTPELPPAGAGAEEPAPLPAMSAGRLMGLTATAGGYEALARQSRPGQVPAAAWIILSAWAAGAGLLLARAAAGRVVVRSRARGSSLPPAAARLAADLRREIGVPRRVDFTVSPGCAAPFTFGIVRPVVVIPTSAAAWPSARLRPVLLHELAHVKHGDALANLLSTLATSLLWCFPPAWVASRFLARVAELACDRLVLEHGVPPRRYASDLLELLRTSGGSLFVAPAGSSFAARRAWWERIASVLAPEKPRPGAAARAAAFGAMGLLCALAALLALTFAAVPIGGEGRLVGTWSNAGYFGTYWTHAYEMKPGGRMAWYDFSNEDMPTGEARYVIDRQWRDAEDATWYFMTARSSYYPYNQEVAAATLSYSLLRVDANGDRLDMETSLLRWPERFGALGNYHYVYYRSR